MSLAVAICEPLWCGFHRPVVNFGCPFPSSRAESIDFVVKTIHSDKSFAFLRESWMSERGYLLSRLKVTRHAKGSCAHTRKGIFGKINERRASLYGFRCSGFVNKLLSWLYWLWQWLKLIANLVQITKQAEFHLNPVKKTCVPVFRVYFRFLKLCSFTHV